MPGSRDLLDANVWLALLAEAHTHHRRAQAYWQEEAAPRVAFCRVTHLALLRLLTNPAVMGEQVLTPTMAWRKVGQLLALEEVQLLSEPAGLEDRLGHLCQSGRTSPNLWTDAYLAAFAQSSGLRLVTFDQGFSRFSELELLVLKSRF